MDATARTESPARRVLVVDDEPVIGRVCKRVLEAAGFAAQVAANGDVARAILDREEFDLCLLDVRVPGMNGMQLYRYLRSLPANGTRVIFMTGDVLSASIARFLDETGAPHLAKPFTPAELEDMVKQVMSLTSAH